MSLLPELPLTVSEPMTRALLSARELVVRVAPLTMRVLLEEAAVRPSAILSRAIVPPLVRMRVAPLLVTPTLSRPVVPPFSEPVIAMAPLSTVLIPWKVLIPVRVTVPVPIWATPPIPPIALLTTISSERLKMRRAV